MTDKATKHTNTSGSGHGDSSLLPPSPVYILRGAESPVTTLEFTESSCSTLLSGCQDGRVHLWNLCTRRIKDSIDAHAGKSVLLVRAFNGSRILITQGRDGFVKIWKNTGSAFDLDGLLKAGGDVFCSGEMLTHDSSKNLIAVPGKDSVVSVYDLHSRSLIRTLTPSSGFAKVGLCMCLCVVPGRTSNASQIIAGYESGEIILWDVGTGKSLHQFSAHPDAVMCVAYSSANINKGLSGSVDERLAAWRISDDGRFEAIRKIECTNAGFNDMKIRSDDKIAATAGWDNYVRIFNMKSLRPLAVLPYHRDSVHCVEFSNDFLLAAGSKDNLITLWDIYR